MKMFFWRRKCAFFRENSAEFVAVFPTIFRQRKFSGRKAENFRKKNGFYMYFMKHFLSFYETFPFILLPENANGNVSEMCRSKRSSKAHF